MPSIRFCRRRYLRCLAELDPTIHAAEQSNYLQSAIIGFVDRVDETAGGLLRRARRSVGISQAELAFRAGVAQSVISAYEAGRRQPSLLTLAKLIDAAGCDLVVDIQRQPAQLTKLSGPVGRQVRRRRRDLVAAAILGTKVDLVPASDLKPAVRGRAERDLVAL